MSMGLSRSGAGLTRGFFRQRGSIPAAGATTGAEPCGGERASFLDIVGKDDEVLRPRFVNSDLNAGAAELHRSMAIVFAVAFRVSMNRRATGER